MDLLWQQSAQIILHHWQRTSPVQHITVTAGRSSEIIQLLKKEEIQIGIVIGNETWDLNGSNRVVIQQDPICVISYKEIEMETLPIIPRIDYTTGQSLKSTITRLIDNGTFIFFTEH